MYKNKEPTIIFADLSHEFNNGWQAKASVIKLTDTMELSINSKYFTKLTYSHDISIFFFSTYMLLTVSATAEKASDNLSEGADWLVTLLN